MKQAKTYEPKIRKLLKGLSQAGAPEAEEPRDPVEIMLLGILQANATEKQAAQALEAIRREYVDYNELRVSPPKDLYECIGQDVPHPRAKAGQILQALSSVYARVSRIDLEYLAKIAKRDLRRLLGEMGLDEYAAGYLMMVAFGHHAIPVDQDLTECLIMKGCVHPESDPATVQSFLERLAPKKQTAAVHAMFREYVQQHAKHLDRKRQAEAEVREKAEAEARAAEAKAKAEAEAADRKREEEQRAQEAEAKAKAKAEKSSRKKAARKTTKKASAAKKSASKKSAAKRAARPAKSSAGSAAKKAAGKKGGTSARKSTSRKASSAKGRKTGKTK